MRSSARYWQGCKSHAFALLANADNSGAALQLYSLYRRSKLLVDMMENWL
jgi:hypothetical protein